MNSRTKIASLCLLTLFASTFAAQASSSKKSIIPVKKTKHVIEQIDENVSSYADHNCGTDHNGQDWNKLQQAFIEQVKSPKINTMRMSRSLSTFSEPLSTPAVEGSVAVDGRYYIPVVIHVYGDEYNCADDSEKCLTDDKINDALLKLNNDFQGHSVDEPAISPQFAAIRENLNIEFVLAKKDPNGNATTGIVRYNHEQAGYANIDADTQDAIAADSWDNFKYMNVYLQHDLHDDGVGNNSGVAWYPDLSMTEAGTARVVYNGHYTGLNTSENFRSVLTHEFGHWLNLIHTFETKTCSITNEAFCATTGDKNCDTPQMSLPSQMQANAKNCLGQPTNTENFMHYTKNYAMFTEGQVARMTAALHGPARSTLWSNDNLIATGLELLTTDSEHAWDGISGLDGEPQGTVLETIENISGTLDEVITHEINLPTSATNILFHLDGHTADPDMYIKKGEVPTHDGAGNWDTDYISFNSPGTAEAISIDIPDSNTPYFAAIHAFTAFDNSRLRVIQGNDPFLAEGESRYTLFKIDDLKANKLDTSWEGRLGKKHNFQFTVPDDATRVVVVVPGGYNGPIMASGVPNFNGDLDLHVSRNQEVSLETYDCRPFSWKGLAEYCEFDGGGTYNVMIDPFQTYTSATLHVYYETVNTGNQLPFANTNGNKHEEGVNHAIEFSSVGSNDPDGEIISYAWDFGDGTQSNEANVAHTYDAIGEYNVTLTVTDNNNESTTASTLAVITQYSPFDAELCDGCSRVYLADEINLSSAEGATPNMYYFEVPDAASLVTFELVDGYNGDPDIHVSQNQDVSIEQFTCRPWNAPGQSELCQVSSGGVFNVMLDPFHAYDSVRFRAYYDIHADADHSAPNKLPKANAGGNYTAIAGDIVQFNGLSSTDEDGTIDTYLWDFGHGVTSTGATVDHVYAAAGTYFVTLTVTDNEGATHSNSTTVSIAAVGDMDGDGDVDVDDIAALTTAVNQGTSVDSSFDLNNDGVVNSADITLMNDICSYDNCTNIAPPPQAPIAVSAALNNNVQINTDVMFSSEGSSDQYGQIVTYSWDFGDGNTSNWSAPTHQFSAPGIYDVVLTLTDNDDMTAISTVTVNVDHAPLDDVCNVTPAPNERDLLPSIPTCIGTEDSLTIPQVNRHKTIAISMINAPENSLIYFGDTWPRIDTGEYTVASTERDGQQCAFYVIPEDSNSWGYIQLSGTPAGATIVVDYDVASCRPLAGDIPADNALQNGVSQVAAAARGEDVHFTMHVPANVSDLTFGTEGGTGDADLYVKFGSEPTTSDYDCRPYKGGNVENCAISNAQEGTYYVMLRGYNDFSDVNVTGNYLVESNSVNVAPVAQTNGPFVANVAESISMMSSSTDVDGSIVSQLWNFGDGTTANAANVNHAYTEAGTYTVTLTVTDSDGASTTTSTQSTISAVVVGTPILENGVAKLASGLSNEEVMFTMDVPVGATNLVFNTSGGSGDADLHVKFGSQATSSDYDCRPWKNGSTERCTIHNIQAGTYHIMLRGHTDFSDVSLVGTYTP